MLKHFARLLLVVIALCCITTVSAFAYNTYTVEISFSNPNEYPYEYSSLSIYHYSIDDTIETTVNINNSVSLDITELYSNQVYITVLDGDLGIYEDGEFDVSITDVGIPDGVYNVLFTACYNYGDDGSIYCPIIQDIDPVYSAVSNGSLSNYYFLTELPSLIDFEIVDITDSYDTESGYLGVRDFILFPAPPPPPSPLESITNVWSGVLPFLTTSISTVSNVFWDGSSLTLLGMLGLIGVSIAIIILIFLRVKDFLKLR